MLIDRLKADILFAVKAKSELAIGLLKLVLGECQAKDNYNIAIKDLVYNPGVSPLELVNLDTIKKEYKALK